jgi:hypothetical protein
LKECPRCRITFHLDDRIHCLYCETLLVSAEEDKTDLEDRVDSGMMGIIVEPIFQKVVNDRGIQEHSRLQFIVASYFRTRTFLFMYKFSRNNFKKGSEFKCFFIQPVTVISLLLLPWLAINIIDSILCRFLYTKYCPKCGWKFFKHERNGEHSHRECEYNREYQEVIDSIMSGMIIQKEKDFKRLGLMKRNAGRKSAYWDLCGRRSWVQGVLDVASIWFSIIFWLVLVIWLIFPAILSGVYMLEL